MLFTYRKIFVKTYLLLKYSMLRELSTAKGASCLFNVSNGKFYFCITNYLKNKRFSRKFIFDATTVLTIYFLFKYSILKWDKLNNFVSLLFRTTWTPPRTCHPTLADAAPDWPSSQYPHAWMSQPSLGSGWVVRCRSSPRRLGRVRPLPAPLGSAGDQQLFTSC